MNRLGLFRRRIHHLKSSIIQQYWDDVMKYSHEREVPIRKHKAIPPSEIQRLVQQIVKSKREDGDIWPTLLCKQFCDTYCSLDISQRAHILTILGTEFGLDQAFAQESIERFQKQQHRHGRAGVMALQRLRNALEPAYESLFHRISQLPGGLLFLIQMRAHCLSMLNLGEYQTEGIQTIEAHLKLQFQHWFNSSGMELERISWKSPANILEKIVKYERVHAIPSWEALKQRLGPGRLCFSFFHPAIPHEPLTFVQVALLNQIPSTIEQILQDPKPGSDSAFVAIFYSITSSQKGLSGVDLGQFLIKRVVKEIQATIPQITTFCTLSPIPNFRKWILNTIHEEDQIAYPDHSLPASKGIHKVLLPHELALIMRLPKPNHGSNLKDILLVIMIDVVSSKERSTISSAYRGSIETHSRTPML
jgi:hypothetical protein